MSKTALKQPFLFFTFLFIGGMVLSQQNPATKNPPIQNLIRERQFILINGIEQWVTISGERSKPVILFIHGGPGNALSPYSESMYQGWEKDFIIVQWDQRGTGRTFGRQAPEGLTPEYLRSNPLTTDQLVKDGIGLSEYLVRHLGKEKIFLFGTSWGSVIATKMVALRPELFYAYVGHSQVIRLSIDSAFYRRIVTNAAQMQFAEALKTLREIGFPPYRGITQADQLLSIVDKLEMARTSTFPDRWRMPSVDYDSMKDSGDRDHGHRYSLLNLIGDQIDGLPSMSSTINLLQDNSTFKIPVYFLQGAEDLLSPWVETMKYFNTIKAPKKELYLLPRTGHLFTPDVLTAQFDLFKQLEDFCVIKHNCPCEVNSSVQ